MRSRCAGNPHAWPGRCHVPGGLRRPGILVDPQRDTDRFLRAADEAGVPIRWVLETHVHNDYVSGALPAARRAGARLVLPAGAGAAFDHVPAFHGRGSARGQAGHPSAAHAWPHAGALQLPAACRGQAGGGVHRRQPALRPPAGRTDLLGAERARQLARLQHGSLRRLAALPGAVAVYRRMARGRSAPPQTPLGMCPRQSRRSCNPTRAGLRGRGGVRRRAARRAAALPRVHERMASINVRGSPRSSTGRSRSWPRPAMARSWTCVLVTRSARGIWRGVGCRAGRGARRVGGMPAALRRSRRVGGRCGPAGR